MPIKFVFLILDKVHFLDLAGPDQVLQEAVFYGAHFQIDYCYLNKKASTSGGLKFNIDKHYSEIKLNTNDYLIIAGADVQLLTTDEFKANKKLFTWLSQLHQNKVNICTICTGAFVLAHAGLLNDKQCTTHFKYTTLLQMQSKKIIVKENVLFVKDENIYTSAGIASGIDLMLYIVEQIKGSHFAHKVARELVVYTRRDGMQEQHSALLQFRNHIHNGIHKVQDYIIENIAQKHSLYQFADLANMSERNFTRVFKNETGITVVAFINSIRKELATQLLQNPDSNKLLVANKLGLQSERQLNRILK